MKNLNRLLLPVVLTVAAAGCATVPEPTQELQAAQSAYNRAKENPDVLRYGARDLETADETLVRAAEATNMDEMNSLAYVASSQVQLAEAKSQRQLAETKIAELSQVKNRVQLEVREAELQASRAQLAALQAKETERGTVVTLGSVLFATGKSELLAGALQSVERLADYLTSNKGRTVLIEGHTDSTGSDETNLRLSQDRADSVRMALIAEGIAAKRIVATGLSSTRPVASNDTAAGRQQNRRVEIVIQ